MKGSKWSSNFYVLQYKSGDGADTGKMGNYAFAKKLFARGIGMFTQIGQNNVL